MNMKVPTWSKSERRAFTFSVADPSATLYCAILDEDDDPLSRDDPIGRCALALRSLAPGAVYDASSAVVRTRDFREEWQL